MLPPAKTSEIFLSILNWVLELEGSFVDHPDDKGGKTAWGITEALAREAGYTGEMQALTKAHAIPIYRSHFWGPLKCDELSTIDLGITGELFECAVNVGIKKAAKILQNALELLGQDIEVDGVIGPATLEAIKNYHDKQALLKLMNVLQGSHYAMICAANPSQRAFLRGWLKRCDFEAWNKSKFPQKPN